MNNQQKIRIADDIASNKVYNLVISQKIYSKLQLQSDYEEFNELRLYEARISKKMSILLLISKRKEENKKRSEFSPDYILFSEWIVLKDKFGNKEIVTNGSHDTESMINEFSLTRKAYKEYLKRIMMTEPESEKALGEVLAFVPQSKNTILKETLTFKEGNCIAIQNQYYSLLRNFINKRHDVLTIPKSIFLKLLKKEGYFNV